MVLLAFVVEATAGFGATVVTVTLAAQVLPIAEVLAAFVPVNVILSLYLLARHGRHVSWPVLARRILPLMGLGMVLGLLLARLRGQLWLKAAFALFVVVLAAVELLAERNRQEGPAPPLSRLRASGSLLLAGFIHGLFACGGPLAVYVLGRIVDDKARFRATLAALWIILNTVLVATYVQSGAVNPSSLVRSAMLLPPLVLGILLGEWVHDRLDGRAFRRAVFGLLLFAGASLLVRSLLAA